MANVNVMLATMTPEWAASLLDTNTDNRNVRPMWVNFLAGELKRGAWKISNDAVVVMKDGTLGNGQHRLMAIVAADLPAQILFVEGLTKEDRKSFDGGQKRTPADHLGITNHLAADITLICRFLGRISYNRVPVDVMGDVIAWWSPYHQQLGAHYGGRGTAGLSNSQVRVAAGVQWAIAGLADRQYLMDQYKALMTGDAPGMSKAVAALWKRCVIMKSKAISSDYDARMEKTLHIFRCLDPTKRDVEPFVRKPEQLLEEFRGYLAHLEQDYIEGMQLPLPNKRKVAR